MSSIDASLITLVLVYVLLACTIVGACAEYTIEYWASAIKGEPVDIPFAVAIVAGMFGPIPIGGAIITLVCDWCDVPSECQYVPN